MKKASLIVASVFLAFTGCGRGWLPCLHRGDACMNQCGAPLAAAPACDNCGVNTVGYEGIPSVQLLTQPSALSRLWVNSRV